MYVIVTYAPDCDPNTLGFCMKDDGSGEVQVFGTSDEAVIFAGENLNEGYRIVAIC